MSDNQNSSVKLILKTAGAYVVTMVLTILFIVLAIVIFIDTTKCSSISKAFPVLLGTIAVVFLASIILVRVMAWKAIQSVAGRWAILAVYGAVLFASFILTAFGLLLIFNC